MAALESFVSDDEMRDSAIYSESEECGVTPSSSVVSPSVAGTEGHVCQSDRQTERDLFNLEDDLKRCSLLAPRKGKLLNVPEFSYAL